MMLEPKLIYSFKHKGKCVEIIKHGGNGDLHYHIYLDGCLTDAFIARHYLESDCNTLIDLCNSIMLCRVTYGGSMFMKKFIMSIPEEYPELFL